MSSPTPADKHLGTPLDVDHLAATGEIREPLKIPELRACRNLATAISSDPQAGEVMIPAQIPAQQRLLVLDVYDGIDLIARDVTIAQAMDALLRPGREVRVSVGMHPDAAPARLIGTVTRPDSYTVCQWGERALWPAPFFRDALVLLLKRDGLAPPDDLWESTP